jgi:hypothetical protein
MRPVAMQPLIADLKKIRETRNECHRRDWYS